MSQKQLLHRPVKSKSANSGLAFTMLSTKSYLHLPPANYASPLLKLLNHPQSSRDGSKRISKERGQLRRKVKELGVKVDELRVRRRLESKNYRRINSKLNTQFKDEVVWGEKKSYFAEGVKHQYYALKEQYERKCEQMEEMIKKIEGGSLLELQIYCQHLEQENTKLRRMVEQLFKTEHHLFERLQLAQCLNLPNKNTFLALNQQEANIASLLKVSERIVWAEERCSQAQKRAILAEEKIQGQRRALFERKNKIQHLRGLIKKMENDHHKKILQFTYQNRKLAEEVQQLKATLAQQQHQIAIACQEAVRKEREQKENQRNILERYLKASQVEIDNLRKEISKRQQRKVSSTQRGGKKSRIKTINSQGSQENGGVDIYGEQ